MGFGRMRVEDLMILLVMSIILILGSWKRHFSLHPKLGSFQPEGKLLPVLLVFQKSLAHCNQLFFIPVEGKNDEVSTGKFLVIGNDKVIRSRRIEP